MKKLFRDQENRRELFLFLAVMIVACGPLLSKYCINGHDLEYHLLRIESLKEGILMGRPFERINVLFLGGAGYASSLFYPDLFLYLPALLRAAGVGIAGSYHIYVVFCVGLTYLSMRFCVKKITGSAYAAIMAAALLVLSPYYLGDVLIRGAVGEYSAFIFLPLVICGIYDVLYEQAQKPWMLCVGYGGVLLTHTTTFLFCLLFGAAAFALRWKVFRDLKILKKTGLCVLVTSALTAFYWVPVLEMLLTTPLYVNDPWVPLQENAMQFSCLFSNDFPCVGFLLFALALFRVLIKKNPPNRDMVGFADWLLMGGAFFAVLATDLFPWERLNGYLGFVQFPWRLFVLSTVMLSVADAVILYVFIRYSLEPLMQGSLRVISVLLLVLLSALALRFINNAGISYYDYSDDYYSYKPFTANIIAGEWLPKTVEDKDLLTQNSDRMTDEKGEELPFVRIRDRIEAQIPGGLEYVDVPFVYYRGYRATLDGTALLAGPGENGTCRVYTNGASGALVVKYGGTLLQHISETVSLLALIGLIYAVRRGKNKPKEVKS